RGGLCRRVHRQAAAGLRHPGRRERRAALRWPAPAPGHRPSTAEERAAADSRRGHLGPGYRVRAPHPGGPGRGAEGPHHPGDRPPPDHHREGGPDPGDGPGRDRRARQPCRAAGAERLLRPPARQAVRGGRQRAAAGAGRLMLEFLRGYRERGWKQIDAATYASTWQRFGGSVATHPQVVERLAGLAGIPVRYLGWERGGELLAAIPTWGRHLAL